MKKIKNNLFNIALKKIHLPSVNSKYQGSRAYYTHRDNIVGIMKAKYFIEGKEPQKYEGDAEIIIRLVTDGDVDNYSKAIQDAAVLAGIISDDKNFRRNVSEVISRNVPTRGYSMVYIEINKLDKSFLKMFEDFYLTLLSIAK